jgi:hypothetical protein
VGGQWGSGRRRGRRLVAVSTVVVGFALVASACNFTTLTSARWGCGTHKYVINPAGAPKGAVAKMKEAFRQLNQASPKVKWTYAGTTTAKGAVSGLVVVAWRTQADLTAAVMRPGAWAASAPQPWPNKKKWTGGTVFIDPSYPPSLGIMLHELGHIAGLGHVADPNQVMYANPRGKTHYMDGDRAGLLVLSLQCR